jgi:hypothetical protein
VYLTALTCINGKYVCANDSTPLNTFTTQSFPQCVGSCASTKNPAACIGVNYHAATNTCSLFGNAQPQYVVQPGCKYFTVCRYKMLPLNLHSCVKESNQRNWFVNMCALLDGRQTNLNCAKLHIYLLSVMKPRWFFLLIFCSQVVKIAICPLS